ncbi:MAG: hypothetical protein R3F20_02955 [Planctomycetota bacterium]
MTRALPLLSALALLVAIVLVASRACSRSSAADQLAGTEETSGASTPADSATAARRGGALEPDPDGIAEPDPADPRLDAMRAVPETGAEAAPLEVLVEVTVVDDRLGLVRSGSGRLDFAWADTGGERRSASVTFREGRTHLNLPPEVASLRFTDAWLDPGHRLTDASNRRWPTYDRATLERETIDLLLTSAERFTLHARGAADRHELEGVRVYRTLRVGTARFDEIAPGTEGERPLEFPDERLVARGDSPLVVVLTEGHFRTTDWIVAPGHAARTFTYPPTAAEFEVELAPGGDLLVRIEGELGEIPGPLRPRLRLNFLPAPAGTFLVHSPFSPLCDEAWTGQPEMTATHLPVGPLVVSLESGPPGAPDLVLDAVRVEIEAGRRTEVRLRADTTPLRETLIPVFGVVTLPDVGMGTWTPEVEIRAVGEESRRAIRRRTCALRPDAKDPLRRKLDEIHLTPGDYVIRIDEEEFPFTVPASGRCDLALRLAAREPLLLELKRDGRPVTGARIDWSTLRSTGRSWFDESRGAYPIPMTWGSFSIDVRHEDTARHLNLRRDPGQNRMVVDLPPMQGFRVELRCGDEVVPDDFELRYELRRADSLQTVLLRRAVLNDGAIWRFVDEPGRHEIRLAEGPKGYRATDWTAFDLGAGGRAAVRIELRRAD